MCLYYFVSVRVPTWVTRGMPSTNAPAHTKILNSRIRRRLQRNFGYSSMKDVITVSTFENCSENIIYTYHIVSTAKSLKCKLYFVLFCFWNSCQQDTLFTWTFWTGYEETIESLSIGYQFIMTENLFIVRVYWTKFCYWIYPVQEKRDEHYLRAEPQHAQHDEK